MKSARPYLILTCLLLTAWMQGCDSSGVTGETYGTLNISPASLSFAVKSSGQKDSVTITNNSQSAGLVLNASFSSSYCGANQNDYFYIEDAEGGNSSLINGIEVGPGASTTRAITYMGDETCSDSLVFTQTVSGTTNYYYVKLTVH
jgi:hypothetical protein